MPIKSLTNINWIIITIWAIIAIFIYFGSKGSGMDAAGRGMALGFLMIGIGYIVLMALLNLINVKWVRVMVLLMATLPIGFQLIQSLTAYSNRRALDKRAKNLTIFQHEGMNDIARAIRDKNPTAVETLLIEHKEKFSQNNQSVQSILLNMSIRNALFAPSDTNLQIIKSLLDHGANPNIQHEFSPPTLIEFAEQAPLEIFALLLKHGASPNIRDHNGAHVMRSLVDNYSVKDQYEKVKLLIEYGIDPNTPLGDKGFLLNWSALTSASASKNWKVSELLIEHGADMGFTPSNGRIFAEIINTARQDYQEKGEFPEDYQKLIENPKVIAFMGY